MLPGAGKPRRLSPLLRSSTHGLVPAVGLSHPSPAEPQPTAWPAQPSLASAPVPPLQLSRGRAVPWRLASRKLSQRRRFIGKGAFSLRWGDTRLRYRILLQDRVVATGTGRGVLEEGGTTAASAGGQVGAGQDNISVSQPSLLKSLRTISVAAERNQSPGLLLLHDAKYLSPLCFLSFSRTHMHAVCGSN